MCWGTQPKHSTERQDLKKFIKQPRDTNCQDSKSHLMAIPGGEKTGNGGEAASEKIVAKNFYN